MSNIYYGYIYKTTIKNKNSCYNNHFYIGQRKLICDKKYGNKYFGSGKKIKNYIKKHGKNTLQKEILIYTLNQKELNKKEEYYIKPYLNNPLCLNLINGGKQKGMTEETRKKISNSLLGHIPWNKGLKGYMKGKITSEETKIKLSNLKKGRKLSEEHKKKLSIAHKGKRYSDEINKKKGRIPWNKGLKGAQVAWNKGLKMTKRNIKNG